MVVVTTASARRRLPLLTATVRQQLSWWWRPKLNNSCHCWQPVQKKQFSQPTTGAKRQPSLPTAKSPHDIWSHILLQGQQPRFSCYTMHIIVNYDKVFDFMIILTSAVLSHNYSTPTYLYILPSIQSKPTESQEEWLNSTVLQCSAITTYRYN